MIMKCDENNAEESNKEESCEDSNENVTNNDDNHQKSEVPFDDRLENEADEEKFEIQPHQLTIVAFIGKGYYSDVHLGTFSLPNANIPVAVKTPKKTTGSINPRESEAIYRLQMKALRDELKIFAHLQSSSGGGHENVLKLVGAITRIQTDFCILTEYCERGSLDHFLQNIWKNSAFEDELVSEENENENIWKIQRDSSWDNSYRTRRESGIITTSDLLWFALQIARAMQFLAEKNVIHRDVAVRNVLLKSDFTIKVADFGLSRKLKEGDEAYYVWKERTALPIRYIASESLKFGRFSITSEYWSFGVVVWELFTFAQKQPYSDEFEEHGSGRHFRDFLVDHLSSGHRLSVPDNVPIIIKKLLAGLWHSDPKKRPTFQACTHVIKQVLMQSCPNMLPNDEKLNAHSSEYSSFVIEEEDSIQRGAEYLNVAEFNTEISTTPSRKLALMKILARLMRRNSKLIIVGFGILAVIVIVIIVLIFTVINKSPEGTITPNSTNIKDLVCRELSLTLGNMIRNFELKARFSSSYNDESHAKVELSAQSSYIY